jgi:hypothetical protein
MPQTDRSRPEGDQAAHETVSGTTVSVPRDQAIHDTAPNEPADGVPPHPGSWRERVDLAAADPALAYRCGLEDGYRMACDELGTAAALVVDHLQLTRTYERLELKAFAERLADRLPVADLEAFAGHLTHRIEQAYERRYRRAS